MLSLVYVEKDPGRNTDKLLVLLEPDFCPYREYNCPVLPKLRLHHGGKQRLLLKSLQTDWKELKMQADSIVSLGKVLLKGKSS